MAHKEPFESQSDSDDEEDWLLGFAEPPIKNTDLLRHRFPSKIGGRPAWLDPLHLPTREQLTCSITGKLMNFLLQVYAPVDDNPAAFHRTISLFISPQGDQLTKPGTVRALRCQLPRDNPFYPIDPAPKAQLRPTPLSSLAGGTTNNTNTNSNTNTSRRSSDHDDPWNVGHYEQQKTVNVKKNKISTNNTNTNKEDVGNALLIEEIEEQQLVEKVDDDDDDVFLYPEKELVVEPEDIHDNNSSSNNNHGGGKKKNTTKYDEKLKTMIAEYKARSTAQEASGVTGNKGDNQHQEDEEDDLSESVLNELEDGISKEQRHFASFAARIAHEPAQCLRYCFNPGAHPIWPSCHNIPGPADIPPCQQCGSERRFEFQVMPQLINHLGVESDNPLAPDWGMLAVYSCGASCSSGRRDDDDGNAYVEEFVWVQPGS